MNRSCRGGMVLRTSQGAYSRDDPKVTSIKTIPKWGLKSAHSSYVPGDNMSSWCSELIKIMLLGMPLDRFLDMCAGYNLYVWCHWHMGDPVTVYEDEYVETMLGKPWRAKEYPGKLQVHNWDCIKLKRPIRHFIQARAKRDLIENMKGNDTFKVMAFGRWGRCFNITLCITPYLLSILLLYLFCNSRAITTCVLLYANC